jgi:hypothetical protein
MLSFKYISPFPLRGRGTKGDRVDKNLPVTCNIFYTRSAIIIAMKKLFEAIGAVFIIAACVILRPLFRPWYSRWGAIEEERTMKLPGDEIVPRPRGGYTQAISIWGEADDVWPWVVQIGQGKGGFYSYELLENLVGCNIHNAGRIFPEYQDVKVGDEIVMHPKAPIIPVVIIESGKTLVGGVSQDEENANVWIFHIMLKDGLTRLISRWTYKYKPVFLNKMAYWFLEPIAAVMQRKMLLTIKKLAEANTTS